MDWPTQCMGIIPCLNEERYIAAVVRGVRAVVPNICVVDDGSTDRTAAIAGEAGAIVLRHSQSRGKGAALATGWTYARQQGFNWALSLDGDGQHVAEDIPAFFRYAENSGAALVVGNRMPDAAQIPWLRRVVNRWMSRQISRRAGRPLPDSQCGFRLMNLPAWSQLTLRTGHFEIESEVLLAFLAAGRKVEFVPIRVVYKEEQSKIRPFLDTVRWLKWWMLSGRPAEVGASSPRPPKHE